MESDTEDMGRWDDGILELLTQHRSMPSEPEGKSPAEHFLNWHTQMAYEPQSVKLLGDNTAASATTVSRKDQKTGMDKDPDLAHLRPLFRVGECVLVKAGPVPKSSSPYRGPYIITEVLGCYTFHQSDGQRWSTCAMK